MEVLHHILQIILQYYWIPLLILYIGVIGTILIENRNPSKTIAWIMVIVFLPGIGLLSYYFFGQKFKKVKRMKRVYREQSKKLLDAWRKESEIMEEHIDTLNERIGSLAMVFRYLKNQKISTFSLNNEVTLFINGEEKFPVLIDRLKAAEHSIHMEYYIWEMDEIGCEILHILEEKAKNGVTVRLILDSFGAPEVIKYLRRNKPNFEFQAFLPVTFSSLANSNYRNHRKIVVIDGKIGFVGGINISDRYINNGKNEIYWRDTAMMVIGAAVNTLQIQFWNSWNQTEAESFELGRGYLNRFPLTNEDASGVGFTASDPGSPAPFNMEAIIAGINEAKEYVQLCTPYFIPSDQLTTALMLAVSSGVRVDLMLPAKSDSYFVQHASFSFIKPLLERGVNVYLYKKGFLHAKTVCIDGKLAYIGTTNLDIRSFYINFEISGIISDKALCDRLNAQFLADIEFSDLITIRSWMQRSRWKRGVDSICRLLAPLL
ncbi:cardiolipin synthase [uncultured Sphingobacterium sp.]|uniref:cardiolipin synthase n=1 Tax=uncultured Sphingobacterium sp. TaxID=182688 RepID=UPI0025D5912E|nr:cardiolipin synthase [uncultured Sphingobacterium sp.]